MKKILLFLTLFTMIGFVACSPDEDATDDNGTTTDDNGGGGTDYKGDPDQLRKFFAGEPTDSFVWVGTELYRSTWDGVLEDYGEETDVTGSTNFGAEKMWFKFDQEQTDRIKGFYDYVAAVGNCWWVDPNGKSQLNWQLHAGNTDTMFININEPRPSRMDWVVLDASATRLEWYRDYKVGRELRRDRMVWT